MAKRQTITRQSLPPTDDMAAIFDERSRKLLEKWEQTDGPKKFLPEYIEVKVGGLDTAAYFDFEAAWEVYARRMTELLAGKTKIIWRTRPDIDSSIVLYVPMWRCGPDQPPILEPKARYCIYCRFAAE